MKLTRRSLLKMALLSPLVGDFPNSFSSFKNEPPVKTESVNPLRRHGELTLIIGGTKTGKTALAKFLHERHNVYIMDNCERLTDPVSDCEFIRRQGLDVVAVMEENSDIKQTLLSNITSPHSTELIMRADWVFCVTAVGFDRKTGDKPRNYWWKCATIRDRRGCFRGKWVWETNGTGAWPHIDPEKCRA